MCKWNAVSQPDLIDRMVLTLIRLLTTVVMSIIEVKPGVKNSRSTSTAIYNISGIPKK
jgi:hypothetical protein